LVRRPLVDLGLYRGAEELFAEDGALAECYRRRQDQLIEQQRLYRLRLRYLMLAARQVLRADSESGAAGAELRHAISQLRALDRHHVRRVQAIGKSFEAQFARGEGSALARHVRDIEQQLAHCETVLITGGNVVVLLNRMRLFGVERLLRDKHLIAWSAGAMVLSRQIVLYHDRTPEGRRDPEVLGPGTGLLPGYVLLPDARHRLRTRDAVRVDLLQRRFAPARCVTLDSGAQLLFAGDRLASASLARRLAHGGRLTRLDPV
ncbi:MAG TPA: Type 1 glutamine amidotransferase-like domain-containing protein, partial [Woeseiaceae bacterium]|nr:Type 1 glutamine amidotransferase-like domain-containing protein [Woeseiaceae bacterium]